MSSSFPEKRKSLHDESIERKESLPIELIEEVLSWLPVKSAVRFNIVCKLFHTILQDPKFIEKHMHHAKIDKKIERMEHNSPIKVYSRINGLILEKVRFTGRFQIRNYATNKILQLPELSESELSCSLSHILHTNEYKVLVVYLEGYSGIGMKVLTVGTDIAWRPIEIPISLDWQENEVTPLQTSDGINYIVQFSKPNLQHSKMVAFKLEDETFMEILMPREVLFSSETEFWAIEWELTISLIRRGDDGFCLWVMDHDNGSKWIEKKLVIQTHGTTQDEDLSILNIAQPDFVMEGWLGCHCSVGDQPIDVLYHIESNKILHKGTNTPSTIRNKNTLVSFRGMR